MLLLAMVPARAWAQLSPGPLSRAHADLEGSGNCLRCHDPDEGVSPSLCLECHEQLADRIAAGRGLHAGQEYGECGRCHPEHAGVDFELVWWGEDGIAAFDHGLVGWALDGRHGGADCGSCHRPELVAERRVLAAEDVGASTFLGLSRDCASCHFDEHRGQFPDRGCASCHSAAGWSPASGFDHAASDLPLRGAHAGIACERCHPRADAPPVEAPPGVPVLAPRLDVFSRYAVEAECASCHVDPHEGRFRPAGCADCHSDSAWAPAPGFDHGLTRYPLTGLHRRATCAGCHRTGPEPVYRGLAFSACLDCHADPHASTLGPQCSDCHTTAGWRRAEEGFDHSRTRYPLEGRHRQVACDACHPADDPGKLPAHATCTDCHADAHLGQLVDRPGGAGCERCHDVDGFRPARYDLEDHDASRYPLAGAHRTVACADCHVPVPAVEVAAPGFDLAAAMRTVGHAGTAEDFTTPRLRFATLECAGCHVDAHAGSIGAPAGGCSLCHTVDSWRPAVFPHDTTGFPLEGRHATAACAGCHPGVDAASPWPLPSPDARAAVGSGSAPPGVAPVLRYSGTPTSCGACHADSHGGQFADRGPAGCGACHGPQAWSPSTFDHASSGFPLDGAHARTPCAGCHPPGPTGAVLYRGIPTSCEGCHTEALP